jgi:hypothetical protein
VILPEHAELYVLAASLVFALVLVVAGFVRVVRAVLALKGRVEAYENLAIFKVAEITEARITAAERRIAELPRLRARADAAVAEIETAYNRVRLIVQSVRFVVRKVLAIF